MTRNSRTLRPLLLASLLATTTLFGACTAEIVPPPGGSGGAAVGAGGTSSGGTAAGGTGSGGELGLDYYKAIPNGPTFAFFTKVLKLWTPNNCLGGGCHGGAPENINFNVDDGLYDRVSTSISDDVCLDTGGQPMKLIVPGDPAKSALIRILKEPCENQGRMPGGGCTDPAEPCSDQLPEEYIGFLEQWVANGAPEEGEGTASGGAGSGGAGSGGAGSGGAGSGGAGSGGAGSGGAGSGGAGSGGAGSGGASSGGSGGTP